MSIYEIGYYIIWIFCTLVGMLTIIIVCHHTLINTQRHERRRRREILSTHVLPYQVAIQRIHEQQLIEILHLQQLRKKALVINEIKDVVVIINPGHQISLGKPSK